MGRVSDFRAGDWVEVRSADEILATLDEHGRLEALPFMPEMLQYCGRRFRVYKSAHKTCDTIERYKARRMTSAVHLEGLRCDGTAHGGCQAGCMLFWKVAWLKRVHGPSLERDEGAISSPTRIAVESAAAPVSRRDGEILARTTRLPTGDGEAAKVRYSCQATELLKATTPLKWWEPGQYLKDLVSGNVPIAVFIRYALNAAYNLVMRLHWRTQWYQRPTIRGLAGEKTPTEILNLQVGELVRVRSKDEISRTINREHRNRGLFYDVEMLPHCDKTYRVLRRVEKIIDEKTGELIRMPGACIILDGVTCSGNLSRDRLFCPRAIYPYWHEIWLKRVE